MKLITSTFLISLSLFFIACEDSTTTPILTDVSDITIDSTDITIYSTDLTPVSATVTYQDGTSADGTLDVTWETDYDILEYSNGTIWGGDDNGGESPLSALHGDFNSTTTVKVIKLTSFYISTEISTTGEHELIAKGGFEDNETNRTILKNIVWSADNDAVVSVNDDYTVTIDIQSGDTNVSATMFEDTNTSSLIAPQYMLYSID